MFVNGARERRRDVNEPESTTPKIMNSVDSVSTYILQTRTQIVYERTIK